MYTEPRQKLRLLGIGGSAMIKKLINILYNLTLLLCVGYGLIHGDISFLIFGFGWMILDELADIKSYVIAIGIILVPLMKGDEE